MTGHCPIFTASQAAQVLQQDGIVAIPTETVYGLAGNALSEKAIAKIFHAKERPHFDPLIVHIASLDSLDQIVETIPPQAQKLMEACWPGPLTLVFSKKALISDLLCAGLPTVAVRMPSHPVAQEVIRQTGVPLAAPSANLFGRLSPTTAEAVWEQMAGRIDGVVDGGPCEVGVESTIVAFWDLQKPQILRPGGLSRELLEDLLGESLPLWSPTQDSQVPAPGTTPHHYAPQTPLLLLDNLDQFAELSQTEAWGLLDFNGRAASYHSLFAHQLDLSPPGDLLQAATHLYAYLRRLDQLSLQGIVTLKLPDQGLGLAMNDRLRRAAHMSFSCINQPNGGPQ